MGVASTCKNMQKSAQEFERKGDRSEGEGGCESKVESWKSKLKDQKDLTQRSQRTQRAQSGTSYTLVTYVKDYLKRFRY